jgi:cell division cycle 2-like protein
VWRAEDRATKEIVALKQLKLEKFPDGIPKSALREISILLAIEHEHCVTVKEMVVGSSMNQIYMVMEYMEHELKTLLWDMNDGKRAKFSVSEVKALLYQLLDAIDYLHENYILHRDLKTSNILFNNKGVLKVCDFGLARYFGDPLPTVHSHRVAPFTTVVVTLWYRAPELLLADPRGVISYGREVDNWSIGCIFGEMLILKPMFAGPKEEIEFLAGLLKVTGAPTEDNWPGVTKLPYWQKLNACPTFNPRARPDWSDYTSHLTRQGADLLSSLLCLNPAERMTASQAKEHPWFTEAPAKCSKENLPKWQDSNSETHDLRRRIRSDEGVAMGSHVGVKVNAKKYLEDLENAAKEPQKSKDDGKPVGPLPSGWIERKSGSTGKVYYINVKTKQTTWERPTKPAA